MFIHTFMMNDGISNSSREISWISSVQSRGLTLFFFSGRLSGATGLLALRLFRQQVYNPVGPNFIGIFASKVTRS